jgi:hypothetical protein
MAMGQPPEEPVAPRESTGGFEAGDPVLNNEVMSGIISKRQGRYQFPQGDRLHVRGWIDGGLMGRPATRPAKAGFKKEN